MTCVTLKIQDCCYIQGLFIQEIKTFNEARFPFYFLVFLTNSGHGISSHFIAVIFLTYLLYSLKLSVPFSLSISYFHHFFQSFPFCRMKILHTKIALQDVKKNLGNLYSFQKWREQKEASEKMLKLSTCRFLSGTFSLFSLSYIFLCEMRQIKLIREERQKEETFPVLLFPFVDIVCGDSAWKLSIRLLSWKINLISI